MKEINLRILTDEDIPLLTTWLNKEYIKKWYHEPEDWLTEVRGRHGEYAWLHHFIVMSGNIPIGFCQYYDCYNARELEDWYTVSEPGDIFSIDYLVGNEDYLGKGYGKSIISFLTEKIRTEKKGNKIIVQPDNDNFPSNNVLKANGYVFDSQNKYYCKLLKEE